MTDTATIVKTVLDVVAANYTTFGEKPPIGIIGEDRLDGLPSGKSIFLREEESEDPQYTLNGSAIFKRKGCQIILQQPTKTRRENLITDIYSLLEASSYDLRLVNVRRNDLFSTFAMTGTILYLE